ncbi:MAG: hypothetical protein KAH20_14465 [Methylococcales bacterium]|nr:hypothetical protein [Methylococcales bacterium]
MNDIVKKYRMKVLDDQFSSVTRAVRRNLLVVSPVVILLTVPGIKFNTFIGIDLKEILSNKLAIGALSIVIIYELITFIIYALIDHRQWSSRANLDILEYLDKTINSFVEGVNPIGKVIPLLPAFDDPANPEKENIEVMVAEALDSFNRVKNETTEVIVMHNKRVSDLSNDIKNTNYLQLFRIYLIDWLVPVLIAIYTLIRSKEHILEFLCTLFV